MDAKDIKQLIDLMEDHDLVELEVEEKGRKVRLRKRTEPAAPAVVAVPSGPAASLPAAALGAAGTGGAEGRSSQFVQVVSPMVGTFYRTPRPDAKPFVDAGDKVKPDTTVCIIEAMKVMNEIKAEQSGEIVKILVENGDSVEYGQPLFLLKPD